MAPSECPLSLQLPASATAEFPGATSVHSHVSEAGAKKPRLALAQFKLPLLPCTQTC